MDTISRIPWGKVFSSFVWILGAAIILADFSYHEFLKHKQKAKRTKLFKVNSFKKPFFGGLILITIGVCTSFLLHIFSSKPEVTIIKDMVKISPSSLKGRRIIEDDIAIMHWSGVISSKKIQFEKSEYEIRIVSKGDKAFGETSRLKVYVGMNLIADYFTPTEYEEKIIEFKSKRKQVKRLILGFANRYYDPENKIARYYLWIKSVTISKKDNKQK